MGNNPLDTRGKPIHYSDDWEPVDISSTDYIPTGKSFTLYVSPDIAPISLVLKGVAMKKEDAVAIQLTEGYHNFVCDAVLRTGSEDPGSAVHAMF